MGPQTCGHVHRYLENYDKVQLLETHKMSLARAEEMVSKLEEEASRRVRKWRYGRVHFGQVRAT